jgi:hypothetical protein
MAAETAEAPLQFGAPRRVHGTFGSPRLYAPQGSVVVALANPFADFDNDPQAERNALLGALFIDDLRRDRPGWAADGLCQEYPDVNWFPPRGGSPEPTNAVCRRCLVRSECADWAYARPDVVGIWSATSAKARQDARNAGLSVAELLDAVDTAAARDAGPSTWVTAPCRGCRGNLSRRDLETGDGWCWACQPIAKPEPVGSKMRACSSCEELTPVAELDRHGGYWCARCW